MRTATPLSLLNLPEARDALPALPLVYEGRNKTLVCQPSIREGVISERSTIHEYGKVTAFLTRPEKNVSDGCF
jgi:hypothetical protein